MNGLAIFAFVIMPIVVVTMAYIAVLLHEAAARRLDEAEARSEPRRLAAGPPKE